MRQSIKKLVREPLVHFLLIGAGLFLFYSLNNGPAGDKPNRVVVMPAQVEQMEARFTRTWMRPPTKEELSGLIESHVRDEVYYREAVAMGLEQNDPTIRQRMRMKLEFLLEDLGAVTEPDNDVLTAYLQTHPDKFQIDARISFRQVYLNPEKHQNMQADAKRFLMLLNQGAAPESISDASLMQDTFTLASLSDTERQFGEPFARQVVALVPGDWTGPIYSGLGGHLVKVTEHIESRLPELSEVRSQVEREYLAQNRMELQEKTYAKLRERYEVVLEVPKDLDYTPNTAVAATPKTGSTQ